MARLSDCGHGEHYARGLCNVCYVRALRNGTLDRHPTALKQPESSHVLTPRQAEVLTEIKHGTIQSWADAHKVGLTPRSLETTLYRAGRPDLARKFRPPKKRR